MRPVITKLLSAKFAILFFCVSFGVCSLQSCLPKKSKGAKDNQSNAKAFDTITNDPKDSQNQNPLHCGPGGDVPFENESPETALDRQLKALPDLIQQTFKRPSAYTIEIRDEKELKDCFDLIKAQAGIAKLTVADTTIRSNGCIDGNLGKIYLPKDSKRIHQITIPLVWELFSERLSILGKMADKITSDMDPNEESLKNLPTIKNGLAAKVLAMESEIGVLADGILSDDKYIVRKQKLETQLVANGNRTILNRYYTAELIHSFYCSATARDNFQVSPFNSAYLIISKHLTDSEIGLGNPWYLNAPVTASLKQ